MSVAENREKTADGYLLPNGHENGQASSSTKPARESCSPPIVCWKRLFHRDHLHGQSPLAMWLCLSLGAILALSHHFFYLHLDGAVIEASYDQEWSLRYGNAFALATRTALCVAVGIAYVQHIWSIFRRKAINVKGIDAIIAAPNDVFAFLDKEMWHKNLLGTFIVGILWYGTASPKSYRKY